ncbi:TPA: DEAD/DEAH box helicase [Candidatus Saccharibacteria bacterium]|nr:DEAD/DEAH box helicase [Candidatus Saccharibacteria bacterium]HIO87492.1 DEAD/DEAH box helicase [Candidatus Saccharibacteria bacterium]
MKNGYKPRNARGKNYSRNYSSNNRRRGGGGGKRKFGKTIDPKRFVKPAKFSEVKEYEPTNTFFDFGFNEVITQNLVAKNFEKPTQIQDKSIPVILRGEDVVGIANTGTGKTGAFLLPLLHNLMANRSQKALIIAPTRELAIQIEKECAAFAKKSGLFGTLLIGGVPIGPQLRDLRSRPEIVIGTPGRIKDHLERKTLKLHDFSYVVLDEVDRMLDMGFINDIRDILSNLPDQRQSLFFSATMSNTIKGLIETFTNSPVHIMARTAETSDNVDQAVINYKQDVDKIERLHELLVLENVQKTLIFRETKYSVEKLHKELKTRGFSADYMHGGKSQGARQRALKKFHKDEVDILIATDVAARGIDVDGISHVINYDIPQTYDDYTHRIGRTGRGGEIGYAVTFVGHRR